MGVRKEGTGISNNLDGFLLHSTALRDAPLALHLAGQNFSPRGAQCPFFTTPKCARCDKWIEFSGQVGGVDFCDPEEGCLDCEYGEVCPCSGRNVG